jgi:hypothetical protein
MALNGSLYHDKVLGKMSKTQILAFVNSFFHLHKISTFSGRTRTHVRLNVRRTNVLIVTVTIPFKGDRD